MVKQRIVFLGIFAFALCFVAGCVAESSSAAGTSFHYQLWLPCVTVLGGFICIPIGFFWRKSDKRLGWGLMIIMPLAAILLAPTFFSERVWVDDNGFESHSGIFGMTAGAAVKFDSVKAIRLVEEDTGGRRSRRIDVLYFDMKAGEAVRFPLNNDVKIEASKEILARAKKHIHMAPAP